MIVIRAAGSPAMESQYRAKRVFARKHLARAICGLVAAGSAATPLCALELDAGEDWSVRWDSTAKYNLAARVQDVSDSVVGDPVTGAVSDDSDLAFDTGIVSNRFDLLSEFDAVWRDRLGVRVTGAAWYDHAYADNSDHPGVNDQLGGVDTWGALSAQPGEFTDAAEDLHYRDAELLDAFAFWNFKLGDVSGNLRAGRHTIYWGSSLLLGGAINGAASAMVPIDAAKGFAVPGSEAQELFLPTNKLSTVVQLTPTLTLNGYYSLEWQGNRLPERGSFFSPAEILTNDAEFFVVSPGMPGVSPRVGLEKVGDEKPDDAGDFGFNVQYAIGAIDTDVSVYYVNYSDRSPQGLAGTIDFSQFLAVQAAGGDPAAAGILGIWSAAAAGGFADPAPRPPAGLAADAVSVGQFKWAYKDDIDLFGVSLQKEMGGLSFGLEMVRREGAPLVPEIAPSIQRINGVPSFSGPFTGLNALVPGALAAQGITRYNDFDFAHADSGNYPGAVGDTMHVIVNAVGLLNDSALWQGGSFIVEFTAAWLDEVTANEAVLSSKIKEDDVATAVAVNFNPQYFQVLPGVDMTLPMSVAYGIKGHSPVALGGDETVGNASIGAEFVIKETWTAGLKYNVFFGDHKEGLAGLLKDRDNVAFTIKRTF